MENSTSINMAKENIASFRKQSMYKEIWRRFKKNKGAMIGLVILSFFVLATIAAPLYLNESRAYEQNLTNRFAPASEEHPLGTDSFGRDELTRLVFGGRTSLIIGFVSAFVSLAIGGILGLLVGFYGGTFDNITMRIIDVISAVPTILLALAIVSALGASLRNLMISIIVSRIPAFIRVIRASVLNVVDVEYVEAARAGGTSDIRIIFKHILPNVLSTVIVATTVSMANLLLQAAALSFLGLGIQPPNPEWGYMLSEAREFLRQYPPMMLYPGICIMAASLSMSLIGDGLRDAFDPRLRN